MIAPVKVGQAVNAVERNKQSSLRIGQPLSCSQRRVSAVEFSTIVAVDYRAVRVCLPLQLGMSALRAEIQGGESE